MTQPVNTLSVRERILSHLSARLQAVAAAHGANFIRSPTTPISREQSPALVLVAESEQVSIRSNDRVLRHLVLRLTALARDRVEIPACEVADALLVASHAALFADAGMNGLAIGLEELDCDWQEEDADAELAVNPARYQITYRTRASDISQPG